MVVKFVNVQDPAFCTTTGVSGLLTGKPDRSERPPRTYDQTMLYWIAHWLFSGVALLIVAKIVPGIQVDGFRAALIAALVIGLVSATVGLAVKIILLPFIVLTLGVVYFLVNGLILKLASEFVPGLSGNRMSPAVLG